MSWRQQAIENWKGGSVGALAALSLGLALLLLDSKPGEKLIHLSYDIPFLFRAPQVPEEVVLVYLDEASSRDLQQPYQRPWNRGLYAQLVERLTAERARAVTFDILFSDANLEHPEGDERFAKALRANGRAVLGASYGPAPGDELLGWTFVRGLDSFSDAAAAWGMVELAADQDFTVRKHFHVPENKDDALYSSLAWETAKLGGAECAKDPQERYRERWLNYYGPPGTIPHVSFELAIETNGFAPAGVFSDKVVVVGSNLRTGSANERKDEFRTPYTRTKFGPAVDVQATQILNLLRADWLSRTALRTEVFLTVLVGLLFGYGLSLFRPLPALGLALGGGVLVAVLNQWTFSSQRLWFPWMIVVAAQIPAALLWSVVFNSVQLYVQNRLYDQSLKMFLPPKLVKKFSSDRNLLRPGAAEKQVLTLLFSDIADFTSVSEGLDSDELAVLMNAYFQAAVGDCIHKTDGTVGKFLGDGVFAFWNAPDAQSDHALRACEAALRFRELNQRPIRGRLLRTRVGLHTGVVNVGNFGSDDRVDYTALGENVNLASRLEGLNKFLGTDCLISRQTKAELGDQLLTRPVGSFRLKGFEALVEVHELLGRPGEEQASRPWREAFAEALRNFELRHLELAEMGFREVLGLRPNDGPTRFYLKQIQERASEVTPENRPDTWASYTILREK